MVIQNPLRAHPAREFNTDTGRLQVDVLAAEKPLAPQERRLYGQLLMALNAPYRSRPAGRHRVHGIDAAAQGAPTHLRRRRGAHLLAGTAYEKSASLIRERPAIPPSTLTRQP
jgi:hypothetical protein